MIGGVFAATFRAGSERLSAADLIKLAVSALAVAALVGLAAWARIARPTPPLDEAEARSLFADEFPGQPVERLWLADDGRGAIARSGDAALVLSRLGDGYVARHVPWARAAAAGVRAGRLRIPLGDVAAPRAVLAIAAWPPADLSKDLAA